MQSVGKEIRYEAACYLLLLRMDQGRWRIIGMEASSCKGYSAARGKILFEAFTLYVFCKVGFPF